ncbi:hypothetical protein JDV02_000253 [Purpureocillium takamizusanense]|uniref:Uncharacterized protein n=1 Tax=Purpureocillium takamizusanense TaxID=2060973 RepID=A0A9Q8Q6L8_9HYPO|nr:uncharacterized protein JDV02_000253 [Purpureocillium takamizusanense]UNI13514.1 hypothetical protein JDV02_000253 [Purpureocillium takamizusanense]
MASSPAPAQRMELKFTIVTGAERTTETQKSPTSAHLRLNSARLNSLSTGSFLSHAKSLQARPREQFPSSVEPEIETEDIKHHICTRRRLRDTYLRSSMASSRDKDEVASSLSKLNIDIEATKKMPAASKRKPQVADSWEDDEDDDDDDDSPPGATATASYTTAGDLNDEPETPLTSRARVPSPPPPTPMDPRHAPVPEWDASFRGADWPSPSSSSSSAARDLPPSRRPEKTDAVARRMIAAGLGLKAPRQTEEQKAYQRSVREQERKRREQDKEQERRRQEDTERAKAAVWDD